MDILREKLMNRAFIISLIQEDKLLESSSFFNAYYSMMKKLKVNKTLKKRKEIELQRMVQEYVNHLLIRAQLYYDKRNWAKALICYELAHNYDYKIYEEKNIIKNIIYCTVNNKQYDITEELIKHLLEITNYDKNEYYFIAEIYNIMGIPQKSTKYMEIYLNSKNPDEITAEEYNYCGIYYNQLYFKDYSKIDIAKKSIQFFEKAHEINPYNSVYLHNITILAGYTNEYDKSFNTWQKIFKLGNLSSIQKYDYALLCMKLPKFEDWHKYYHARYSSDLENYAFHSFTKPLWDGEKDISDKILLLHWEQGYGDNILMYGYINRLKKYAKQIKFVVQEPLYSLFKNSCDDIEIISNELANYETLEFDYFLPVMSIPKILNLNIDTISVGENYINVRQELINDYKEKYFNNNKYKIGIAFHGNKNINERRNIPIKYFKELNNLKNIEIYILNKDVPDEDILLLDNQNTINIAKTFHNFEDTAAAIKNCDIILTSDNCIMNLAGALGKKTFCLFNWSSEWRWFDLSGENVVWYTSVKPFVNKSMNDWQPTMKNAVQAIQKEMLLKD